mgnify:CR=1 FL=1
MAMLMDRKKALRNDGVTWDNMFADDFRGGGNVGMQHKMGNPAMQMNMPHMNMHIVAKIIYFLFREIGFNIGLLKIVKTFIVNSS